MMFTRFMGVTAAVALLVLSLGSMGAPPALAAVGDTPAEGLSLAVPGGRATFTVFGTIDPGDLFWYRIFYPGGGQNLGVTLQVQSGDRDFVSRVNLTVNVRTRHFRVDGENWDYPGLSRIGLLTSGGDTGGDRKFWFNSQGEGDTYFLRLTNANSQPALFAITLGAGQQVAGSVAFPPNAPNVNTLRTAPGAPAPQPVAQPTPEPRPSPAATAPEPAEVPAEEPDSSADDSGGTAQE